MMAFMDIWTTILTAILKLIGIGGDAAQSARDTEQRNIGRKLQTADETIETIKTSQDMAKASTNAPTNAGDAIARLDKGDA